MERKNLQQHIRTLAAVAPADAPVVSCYLNLDGGLSESSKVLDERLQILRGMLPFEARAPFERAMVRINQFMFSEPLRDVRGVAAFARAGKEPFFLPLRFRVPLPNWIGADYVPNIYHLVELKQTYDRYVVILTTQKEARILEVALGAVTRELWLEHPELRDQAGRKWSRDHYQRHRREQTQRNIREKIKVVEELMLRGGHTHLILAGDPRMAARVEKALPRPLRDKLVDTVHASSGDRTDDIVTATLSSLVQQRERESHTAVERLEQAIYGQGLGVCGSNAALKALRNGQVDVLLLAKDYDLEPGWLCGTCERLEVQAEAPLSCPQCGAEEMREIDAKAEMVRMAERSEATMEIVAHSDFLVSCGGVGCLLIYLTPEQYAWGAT